MGNTPGGFRLDTPHGAVRVLPVSSNPRCVVVYLHGHNDTVDSSWQKYQLEAQFRASRLDALFVVPEAESSPRQGVSWKSLDDLLLTVVSSGSPRVPYDVIVVAHSGGYTTAVKWLSNPRVKHVILLDALYGHVEDFLKFYDRRGVRLDVAVVSGGTPAKLADKYKLGELMVPLPRIPENPTKRPKGVLYTSQYKHMDLVASGKAIPSVLRRVDYGSVTGALVVGGVVIGALLFKFL